MKFHSIVLLSLLSLLTFSCTDNLTDIGRDIRPYSDSITVGTDIFNVTTVNKDVASLTTRQDSFLLGTFYDEKYGSIHADIMAQVKCPVGYKFHPGSVADSALVVLYYDTWFGDKYSPMEVNIYEMNLNTFDYSTPYPTNTDPDLYCDRTINLGHRIFTAKDAYVMRADTSCIIFKLSNDQLSNYFKDRIFNSSYYASDDIFTDQFKGLYIKADYGTATMLNIKQMDLELYSHYTYTKAGADTLTTVKSVLTFPANSEVRQVNHFLYPDKTEIMAKLAQRDSVNYISSPANFQTMVNIPLNRMKLRMDSGIVNNKKLTVNTAILKVQATEVDTATLAQTPPTYLMLIKESAIDRFFSKNELFSDTCAIMGTYTSSEIGTTGKYEYYYSFNIAALIANELKIAKTNNATPADKLEMRLIPVKVVYNSSSVVTSVKQDYLMSAVTIRSGNEIDPLSGNKVTLPMRIKVVYSGF
jgi:hypothetical protein